MEKISIYFGVVLLIASASAILNGEESPHKPYFARITFRSTVGDQAQIHNKAGSIISRSFILTTGFFFGSSHDYTIFVGSAIPNSQVSYGTVGMIRISSELADSPALVQLITPLNFNRDVQPIRLVPFNARVGLNNEQGMVLGMGGTTIVAGGDLQAAFLRIVSSEVCALNYPNRASTAFFCAFDAIGLSDFCPEDRGSAFTVMSRGQEFLVGIAIEGVCNADLPTRPSAFISIAHFTTIINNIIEGIQNAN